MEKQLTLRGMVIGVIGCIIITCSSMFIALKLSSLPWPIMFVALLSMVILKAMGHTSLNEINVTHTAMSAGAMVAGGLAFTIPGIYMADPKAATNVLQLSAITLGGVILGLIFTALYRKHFVVTEELPYPMGQAAADTLIAGDEGGKKSAWLFGSLGVAGLFAFLRDWVQAIPATWFSKSMMKYGSYTGFYFSPMLVAIGYIIGPLFIGVWFVGGLIGDVGILFGGQKLGLFDAATAMNVKQSLGIGLMVGTGIGILCKSILPKAKKIFGAMFSKENIGDSIISMRWAPIVMVILAAIFATVCDMGVVASIITIVGVWLATAMSCQCVGQTGINPMEIFGIIILLAARGVAALGGGSGLGSAAAIFVAATVAVACGLTGDVMNDFKAGEVLGTDPKAQWIAEVIGGLVGGVVSILVLMVILKAYGPTSFGDPTIFPAAQAAAVSAMAKGISSMPAFLIGLIAAIILYFVNFPVMTLGLGVYLPFYMTMTAFIGGALRFIVDKAKPGMEEKEGTGQIIAAGVLGGEGVIGVVIAIVMACQIIF
ncbi:MAG: OPT/YSL family transporter [Anaerovoracaceae bacterium]|jgi:uncharacterized oligopeptide transporter (OPT) family protein